RAAFTLNPAAPVYSAIFFAVELYGAVGAVIFYWIISHRPPRREPRAPPAGLSVDVFIATKDEDEALLRRTLLAAREMDYPHETWVLDDGARPAVAALARELGCRYLARGSNADYKAGNLNH